MFYFPETDFKISLFTRAACLPRVRSVFCLMIGALLLAWPQGDSQARDQVIYKGEINAFKLNLRRAPSRRAPVVLVMEKGDRVDVVQEKGGIGGWLTVVFRGEKGYIRNRPKYIRLFPPSVPEKKKKPARKIAQDLEKDKPAESRAHEPQPPPKKKGAPSPEKVQAGDASPDRPGDIRQEKKAVETRIAREEEKVDSFSLEEMEIIEGLDQIDRALNRARINADALSGEIRNLTAQMEKSAASIDRLTSQLEKNQEYAGLRLGAIYRLGMIGRMDTAGMTGSLFEFFVRQNAMKQIIQSDFEILERQARDISALKQARQDMALQSRTKAEKEKALRLQIRIKEKETGKKQAILKEIQRKKKLSLAVLASLKASARALDDKLLELDRKGRKHRESVLFSTQKGRLAVPANGNIIARFGPSKTGDYKAFTFQKGIDIRVERGEPVRSVFRGEVMFAEWLKGYGNLLIINHGENYYTLYAHVEEVFKQRGERVDTGEVIATAGDTGSIKGLCLHFEIRHHGKPVNPMKWLKKGV